jgi:hypothetical protein
MQAENRPLRKYLTTKAFVELINTTTGAPLTLSRFRKDPMKGVAPEPAAHFGNRDLFTEEQAPPYVR